MRTTTRLPVLAVLLGLGGLIPFVASTAGILLVPTELPLPRLVAAITAYGAVILSFLGAVHWGLALAGGDAPRVNRMRLALGVLPALVGWAALLVPLVASPLVGVLLLLVGFALTVVVEARAARAGLMPAGYMGLRWLLSAVVMLCLAAVLLARLV